MLRKLQLVLAWPEDLPARPAALRAAVQEAETVRRLPARPQSKKLKYGQISGSDRTYVETAKFRTETYKSL